MKDLKDRLVKGRENELGLEEIALALGADNPEEMTKKQLLKFIEAQDSPVTSAKITALQYATNKE